MATNKNAVADYVKLSYRVEGDWNEPPPPNMALKNLPFTKEALDYTKSTVESQEIRSDRNVRDLIQVGVDAKGSVDLELSDYNELFLTFIVAALFSGGSVLAGTAATGVLTSNANYAANEVVSIAGVPYTFKAALTAAPGVANEILVGASEAASILNLASATNGGSGAGVTYGLPTAANPNVTAIAAAHTLTVTADMPGTGGNTLATTTTGAHAAWGAATLTGGTNVALSNVFTAVDLPGTQGTIFTPGAGTPVTPPLGRAVLFQNLFVNGDSYVGIVTAVNAGTGSFTVSPSLQSGGTVGVPKAVTGTAQFNYRSCQNGVTPTSFFIEKQFTDIGKALAFSGMMIDSLKLQVDSRKVITATLQFTGGNAYEGTDYTVATRDSNDGNVMSASGNVGAIMVGASTAALKSLGVTVSNNLRGQDAIANLFLIGIGVGKCQIMLTLSAYFNSTILFDIMKNDSEIAAFTSFQLGATCIGLFFPRVKLSKALPDVGSINSEVMLSVDGQALLDQTTGASVVASLATAV
jgi:hypothetical protein